MLVPVLSLSGSSLDFRIGMKRMAKMAPARDRPKEQCVPYGTLWFHIPILAVLYPRSLNAECLLRAGGWRNGLEEPEGGEEEEIIERTKASFCSNPSLSVLVLRNDPTVLIKWLSFSSPPPFPLSCSLRSHMYIVTEKARREP